MKAAADYARRQGTNFSIYFPPDEYDDLMAAVDQAKVPRATLIRQAVRDHLKREQRKTQRRQV